MTTIALHFDYHVRPMVIAGDPMEFLVPFCQLSNSMKKRNAKPSDFELHSSKEFHLDPGGMLNTKEPFLTFQIDDTTFSMQASKSGYMYDCISRPWDKATTVPGWVRFSNWRHVACIPEDMHTPLLEWVKRVAESDEAMHATLDFELDLDKMAEDGYLIRKGNERNGPSKN